MTLRLHRLVVFVTLGVFGALGVVLVLPDMLGGLLGQDIAGHAGRHFRSPSHRVHDLVFSFLFGTALVGLLAQLSAPDRNVAGQLMALIPRVGLVVMFPLTDCWVAPGTGFQIVATAIFGGLTLSATMLHPAGDDLFGSFRLSQLNRLMLALVFASTNIGLQRAGTSGNEHYDLGHYGFMTAFSFTVIGVGVLASLRPRGWRVAAWVAAALVALLGLASLAYPEADSSLGVGWALAAIAWAFGFLAVAQLTPNTESGNEEQHHAG